MAQLHDLNARRATTFAWVTLKRCSTRTLQNTTPYQSVQSSIISTLIWIVMQGCHALSGPLQDTFIRCESIRQQTSSFVQYEPCYCSTNQKTLFSFGQPWLSGYNMLSVDRMMGGSIPEPCTQHVLMSLGKKLNPSSRYYAICV